ncbi:MAG: hypothetical protein ABFS18_10660 [Thermodesulfobacteriota bacterium]
MSDDQFYNYSAAEGRTESGTGRRKANDSLPWGLGLPIILVISLSVVASLWFGWKIDKGLGELARNRHEIVSETEVNSQLITRRDGLLAKENIVKKAAVLGLFPPTDKQIRKIKKP